MNEEKLNQQKTCSHNFRELSDNRLDDPMNLEFRYQCERCGATMIEKYRFLERNIFDDVGNKI